MGTAAGTEATDFEFQDLTEPAAKVLRLGRAYARSVESPYVRFRELLLALLFSPDPLSTLIRNSLKSINPEGLHQLSGGIETAIAIADKFAVAGSVPVALPFSTSVRGVLRAAGERARRTSPSIARGHRPPRRSALPQG